MALFGVAFFACTPSQAASRSAARAFSVLEEGLISTTAKLPVHQVSPLRQFSRSMHVVAESPTLAPQGLKPTKLLSTYGEGIQGPFLQHIRRISSFNPRIGFLNMGVLNSVSRAHFSKKTAEPISADSVLASASFRDSLTSEPVASTLKKLFKEAEEADRPLMESLAKLASSGNFDMVNFLKDEERNYKGLYHNYASNFLNVSPEFGKFLYTCVRATNAKRIVEFGTSFGVSTIHLAAALRDNGGGELITTELEKIKAVQAMKNLQAAGLSDLVDIRIGDALETLSNGIKGKIDFVHLDGAFSLYLPVLKLLEPHLRTGALVIGENAVDDSRAYLEYVRNPKNGYHSQRLHGRDEGRGNELTLVTR